MVKDPPRTRSRAHLSLERKQLTPLSLRNSFRVWSSRTAEEVPGQQDWQRTFPLLRHGFVRGCCLLTPPMRPIAAATTNRGSPCRDRRTGWKRQTERCTGEAIESYCTFTFRCIVAWQCKPILLPGTGSRVPAGQRKLAPVRCALTL